MATDIDDALQLSVLNALCDSGEAEMLGVICCGTYIYSAPCSQAINTYYGRGSIPIGMNRGAALAPGTSDYNQFLAQNFPNAMNGDSSLAEEAASCYRRLLVDSPDLSVTICITGFLATLNQLFVSPADLWSPLTGAQLMAQKVKNVVIVAGDYPTGDEYNFNQNPAPAVNFVNNYTGRMEFLGYTLGLNVFTGQRVIDETPAANPVKKACELFKAAQPVNFPRSSWGQMGVIHAVRGAFVGTTPYWGPLNTGSNVVAGDGTNAWNAALKNQAYMRSQMVNATLATLIDDLQVIQPAA